MYSGSVGQVLIAEEFLLLALDDVSGRKTMGSESLEPALGAALIVELVLTERIRVTPADAGWRDRGRVRTLNPAPTDDPELDAVLAELQRREGAKVKDLITPLSTKADHEGTARTALGPTLRDGGARGGGGQDLGSVPDPPVHHP